MKKFKHNGFIALLCEPYEKKQHPSQQEGLDKYVDILDLSTGMVNTVKLYENTKGLHIKKGGSHYLDKFNDKCIISPYMVTDLDGNYISRDHRLFEAMNK